MRKLLAKIALFIVSLSNHAYVNTRSLHTSLWASPQPTWNEHLNLDLIEKRLVREKVLATRSIADYLHCKGKVCNCDNDVSIVLLESGLKAIFKADEGKYAEVAAYRANKILKQRLVPPTVFRTIRGKEGSLQFFVDSDIDLLKDHTTYLHYFSQLSSKDISDMKLFYFVFGQWDISAGNQVICMHNKKVYLALIDNTGINNKQQAKYGDFAFVCRGWSEKRNDDFNVPFPFDNPKTLHNPSQEEFKNSFQEFIPDESILRRMWNRYKTITYCTWRNALWIQYYKGNVYTPNYAKTYYKSTIDAYKKLSQQTLKHIWKEALKTENRNHFERLIKLTLERRDQVLKATQDFPLIV